MKKKAAFAPSGSRTASGGAGTAGTSTSCSVGRGSTGATEGPPEGAKTCATSRDISGHEIGEPAGTTRDLWGSRCATKCATRSVTSALN